MTRIKLRNFTVLGFQNIILSICIILFLLRPLYAQNKNLTREDSLKFGVISSVSSSDANQDKIEFKNETGNSIITFTDEGNNGGSITLKQISPFKTLNKLYNEGGILKFNGTPVGGLGATELNELSDVIFDGSSLFLGIGSGASNGVNTGLNTALGLNSINKNSNGIDNVAIGAYALYNISGSFNVGIGGSSNYYNALGSKNTIIGYQAGYGEIGYGQTGNVFLGYQAGYSELGSNLLYIENSNSSLPLIWGNFTDGSEKVIINGDFHVTGNISSDVTSSGANTIDDLLDAKHDGTNLFIGNLSGSTYSGGSNTNTALGYESMKNITTGGGNTAIGNVSLKANTTGFQNTSIGNSSLSSNTTGNRNVAVGVSALNANTTGKQNTVIGTLADANNQGGTNNTIIGFEAGKGTSAHSKTGNVFLGFQAGYNETGNNKLYIDNSNSSSPLIWGDFTDGGENVKINGDFHVTGSISSDGNGLGASQIDELSDAKYDGTNLFVGFGSGINSDITTSNNTALGKEALKNIIGGDWNVSIGFQSMYSNTSGFSNLASGAQALYSNTTGQYNTANGTSALYTNNTGQNNVANGFTPYIQTLLVQGM